MCNTLHMKAKLVLNMLQNKQKEVHYKNKATNLAKEI